MRERNRISDSKAKSRKPREITKAVELDDKAIEEVVGGSARFQIVKPTTKNTTVFSDPEGGGEAT